MIDTLRRYWIGFLVLVLIGLHAGIVGMIRIQATQVKTTLSCEVDLGSFYIAQAKSETEEHPLAVHLRIHALVPVNHRLQARQLIEQNLYQVRQSIEEYCRQADPGLLHDPLLVDLKTQLMDCMVQTVGETAAEDVVITELKPTRDTESLAFAAPSESHHTRKRMVITRQAKDEARKAEHESSAEGHGEPAASGHGKPKSGGH